MRKIFLLFATFGVLLTNACSKMETAPNQNLTPFTLTATIGDMTKTSYTETDGVMKVQWEADETITLVKTVNESITAMYNLTSTGEAGRTIAEFTGSVDLTGENVKFIAIYPAVKDPATSGSYAQMPEGCKYQINKVSNGSNYITTNINYNPYHICQTADNDASHIKYMDIMNGDVNTTASGAALTSLNKLSALMKLELTLPDDAVGKQATRVKFAVGESFQTVDLWIKASNINNSGTSSYTKSATINLGTAGAGITITNEKKLTAYLVLIKPAAIANGTTQTITLTTEYMEDETKKTKEYTKSVTASQRYEMLPGYIYTINATLE